MRDSNNEAVGIVVLLIGLSLLGAAIFSMVVRGRPTAEVPIAAKVLPVAPSSFPGLILVTCAPGDRAEIRQLADGSLEPGCIKP